MIQIVTDTLTGLPLETMHARHIPVVPQIVIFDEPLTATHQKARRRPIHRDCRRAGRTPEGFLPVRHPH